MQLLLLLNLNRPIKGGDQLLKPVKVVLIQLRPAWVAVVGDVRKVDHLDVDFRRFGSTCITTTTNTGIRKEQRTAGKAPAVAIVAAEPDGHWLQGGAEAPQKVEVVGAKVGGDGFDDVSKAGQRKTGRWGKLLSVGLVVADVVLWRRGRRG